ncbi:hypothetical protein MMYC01_201332 [Madurella mycetomatis]|uniref:Uncharacterized protein n=1 Tax=Madurella mycetomatis TaxID=100816 RepID=A0A175WF27_9PEZI|nr:hypothetical protein MMYC01_201332 [Madurella mycetomatis]
MAGPSKTAKGKARLSPSPASSSSPSKPPHPFRQAPDALKPFFSTLSPSHIYIAHIDPRPAAFKRKIFLVPVAMNVAVLALFAWRMHRILSYYFALITSALGYPNETTLVAADMSYGELGLAVLGRAFTFFLDFVLAVFVWPWPYEFVIGGGRGAGRGSPVAWRWGVGFREKEVYVRRSRAWDEQVAGKDFLEDGKAGRDGREVLMGRVRAATAPMLLQQKTGYLTMDGEWDLDWAGMVAATRLVDDKVVALEAFRLLVLLHHERFGWLTIDLGQAEGGEQDERRRQVFAFRDALASLGKEDLFFRWVEMIQFEATQPGGFTPEKQEAAAQKIRDMFKSNGVDFDELWKETVGTDGLAGMP